MLGPCHPQRRLVASGDVCTVEECSCGVLHVTIGVITMRLHPDVVKSMALTIRDAAAQLAAPHVCQQAELLS